MSDQNPVLILRTPASPPLTATEWLTELRSYCAAEEGPCHVQHVNELLLVSFPSKYTLGWKWEEVDPVDAVQSALDIGALTKETAAFDLWRSRLMAHRERAAMGPCQRMAHDLCDGHPDLLSSVDDSDPHHPAIALRKWPSSWLSIRRGADGYLLVIDGPQGEQARTSGELGPVFEHFDRISHQLHKDGGGE